jgi:hypothetical protein
MLPLFFYLSLFIVVLVVNIAILILLFDSIKGKFTFLDYAQKVIESGRGHVIWVIERLPFHKG